MSHQQFYRTVPVSEPPNKEGYYTVIDPFGGVDEHFFYYFYEGRWFGSEEEAKDMQSDGILVEDCHYLEPIPIPDAAVLRSALEEGVELVKQALAYSAEGSGYSKNANKFITIAREALSQTGDGWRKATDCLPPAGKQVVMKFADGEKEWTGDIIKELSDMRKGYYDQLLWKY